MSSKKVEAGVNRINQVVAAVQCAQGEGKHVAGILWMYVVKRHVVDVAGEQFAYTATVNGMMMRERPATNIYMGAFFAESLIMA